MKKIWNSKLLLLSFAVIATIIACQKNDANPISSVMSMVSRSSPVVEMKYEIETTRFQKVLNDRATESNRFFDLIAAKPKVSRESVIARINEDGSTNMETTELIPLNPVPVAQSNSLPDPSTKIKRSVYDNGAMKMFDADGNLLGTAKVELPKMIGLVNSIKEMKAKTDANTMSEEISAMQLSKMFGLNLTELESKAIASKGKVEIEGNIKYITMPSETDLFTNIIITVDNTKNLPMAQDMVGSDGKSIYRIVYQYDTKSNAQNPKLTLIRVLHFTKSVTNSDVVEETITKLSNVQAHIF